VERREKELWHPPKAPHAQQARKTRVKMIDCGGCRMMASTRKVLMISL